VAGKQHYFLDGSGRLRIPPLRLRAFFDSSPCTQYSPKAFSGRVQARHPHASTPPSLHKPAMVLANVGMVTRLAAGPLANGAGRMYSLSSAGSCAHLARAGQGRQCINCGRRDTALFPRKLTTRATLIHRTLFVAHVSDPRLPGGDRALKPSQTHSVPRGPLDQILAWRAARSPCLWDVSPVFEPWALSINNNLSLAKRDRGSPCLLRRPRRRHANLARSIAWHCAS